jgi:hypothetical protein
MNREDNSPIISVNVGLRRIEFLFDLEDTDFYNYLLNIVLDLDDSDETYSILHGWSKLRAKDTKKDKEDYENNENIRHFKDDYSTLINSPLNKKKSLYDIIQNINEFLDKYFIPKINNENINSNFPKYQSGLRNIQDEIDKYKKEIDRLQNIIDVLDFKEQKNPLKGGKKSRKRRTRKHKK